MTPVIRRDIIIHLCFMFSFLTHWLGKKKMLNRYPTMSFTDILLHIFWKVAFKKCYFILLNVDFGSLQNMILESFIKFRILRSHYIVLLFYRMPMKIQLFSMYWEEKKKNLRSITYIFPPPPHPILKKYISCQEKNPWGDVGVCDERSGMTTFSSRESFKLPH